MPFNVRAHRLAVGSTNIGFIKSPNIGGKLKPKLLVIHYTASGPTSNIANYFSDKAAKVSAHLVVARDGKVTQCVPFDTVAWHAGKSEWTSRTGQKYDGLNTDSIGIEIENWGPLKPSGSRWVSWTGATVDSSLVTQAKHKYGVPDCGWEIFTEAQVEATMEAAQAICDTYSIEEILGHDDIAPGRKSDPGPAWNMASFRAKVFGRADTDSPAFVVRSPTGLNIRKGPGAVHDLIRPTPLPTGTLVMTHEAEGQWRYVSVLNTAGDPEYSGWVHGAYLFET
jgi:N-acetylmuramoyl-L-alanine amidase